MMIVPFREHHRDPPALTRHGFLELNGNSCLATIPILGWGYWGIRPAGEDVWMVLSGSSLLFFSMAVLGSNQFHCWAHASKVPHLASWLQEHHLILTPEGHARHHRSNHTGDYCVTTGWMNILLDGTGFFRLCERALKALGLPKSSGEESL